MLDPAQAGGIAVVVRYHDAGVERLEVENNNRIRVELRLGLQQQGEVLGSSLGNNVTMRHFPPDL